MGTRDFPTRKPGLIFVKQKTAIVGVLGNSSWFKFNHPSGDRRENVKNDQKMKCHKPEQSLCLPNCGLRGGFVWDTRQKYNR